jgi:uncharacterized membrane protein YidH (DUF202 family)
MKIRQLTGFSFFLYLPQAQAQPEPRAQPEPNTISKLMNSMFEKKKRKPNLRPVTGRPSKGAVKVDPKIFFAHERTFLAWLHAALLLAGAAIAIMSVSDEDNLTSQLYGVFLLPVAISFIFYAMYQCKFYEYQMNCNGSKNRTDNLYCYFLEQMLEEHP